MTKLRIEIKGVILGNMYVLLQNVFFVFTLLVEEKNNNKKTTFYGVKARKL